MSLRLPETVEISIHRTPSRFLLEIQDEHDVRRVPLGEHAVTIGTDPEADIRVRDHAVSRRHCAIAVHENGVHVTDLGSRNGTFVGGTRIREGWGAAGCAVLAGNTSIVCVDSFKEDPTEPIGQPLPGVAGLSTPMRRVAAQVRRLANVPAPVLVTGETGVGKELIARALHVEGGRTEMPFVALNVAALPRELVESELFGHERGAFTGATSRRDGAFAEAEGGTLFLDEIGELPVDAQPKLLRALDGYEVRRIGATGSGNRTNVRVVAATHVPLLEHVRSGRFRRDLFHRLEVFVIEVPPLRARPGDILPIAQVLLRQLEEQIGEHQLTPSAIALLAAHDWPGNVRELRNVLLRAAEGAKGVRWLDAPAIVRAMSGAQASAKILGFTPDRAREWLSTHAGNVSAAARAARMPRTTFRKLIAKTG